jgi:hypothetical protein
MSRLVHAVSARAIVSTTLLLPCKRGCMLAETSLKFLNKAMGNCRCKPYNLLDVERPKVEFATLHVYFQLLEISDLSEKESNLQYVSAWWCRGKSKTCFHPKR